MAETSVLIRDIIEAQPDIQLERLATQKERLARLAPNERFFEPVLMPRVFEPSDEFVESQRRIAKKSPEQVYDPAETGAIDMSMRRIIEAHEEAEIQAKAKRRRRRLGAMAFFATTFGTAAALAGTYLELRGH